MGLDVGLPQSRVRHQTAAHVATTLTHFSLTAPTLVTCDASQVALGAVLSQTQDGWNTR